MSLRKASAWATGGLISLGLNAGGLAALALVLQPDPAPEQPLPQSRLTIQTQDVPRIDAPQADGTGQDLSSSPPNSPRAQQGIVQQSRATAAALDAPLATATRPEVPQIKATAQTAAALKPNNGPPAVSATEPTTEAAQALTGVSTPLTASQNAAAPLLASTSPPDTLAPSTAATQALQANTAPATPLTNATATATTQIAAALPQATSQPPLPLPAEKQTAALAWSGAGTDRVAEASLAAIQAFMREGDLDLSDSNIGNLRDGISGILASVPCARLQTTFLPETGQLELRGHIPEDALRGPLLSALSDQLGGAIPISDQLLILPRPQCGALAGIAAIGLPQSDEQLTNPRVIGEDGFARSYTYLDGTRLELDLQAPDYDSFVYVDYFAADGTVIHLQPNTIVPLEFATAKAPLSVGKKRPDGPALDITISAPFGQEIAAAFASSIPLYDGLRPLQEPAGPYLAFLKEQVAQARAADPDFKGEWVYFFITTKAQ